MRTHVIQSNFTAGEITPRLYGRVDLERYGNAAKTCENVTVVVQGGLRRRDGLHFVNFAKDTGKPVRLIPWVFSRDEAYVLEMGEKYFRIYQNGKTLEDGKGNTLEIAHDYTSDILEDITYAQGADTMIFAHPSLPPKSLIRYSQTDWRWSDYKIEIAPFTQIIDTPPAAIKVAEPVGYSDKQPIAGRFVKFELLTPAPGAPTDPTQATRYAGNQGLTMQRDIRAYISVNGGLLKISNVDADGAGGNGLILQDLGSVDMCAESNWTLQHDAWGDRPDPITGKKMGYPAAVALYQQRLLFAGSPSFPMTIWGSAIREYGNFTLGYKDDEAFSFTLSSDQINPITALVATNSLIALTHSSEILISGANNTITPTNVSIRVPSSYGAANIRPVRVGTDLVYVQRAGRKLLAISYDPDSQQGYQVMNLSVLAEHLTTKTGIKSIAYQQEPEGLLHILTNGGELVTVTHDKENQVTGWTRNLTGGVGRQDTFVSIACIPTSGGEDAAYVAVERTINGRTRTYIEQFSNDVNTDSGILGFATFGTPIKEWTALQHLEGEEVDIVCDGVPQPRQTVQNGKITLVRPCERLEIGLPFTSKVVTFKPEFPSNVGTPSGAHVATVHLYIRLQNSLGLYINGDPVPFRTFGVKILDKPVPLFTGDIKWQMNGWDNNEVTIEQRLPLPFNMLAVIRTMTVN